LTALLSVIGGIGFFLLGMGLMSDGLKAIAGDTLRKLLNRFTSGTLSSIATGTVITMLVQSSTATTLMTIGFVSAGMLTLLQATGIIFGANLGTTSIGWIVAVIGLKFSVSALGLPLIGLGVMMKQFSKGKTAHFGLVLAGFGLLFVGIQFLQDGMVTLNEYLDLSLFPGDTMWGRLVLILIGLVMTVVMQSSGAAVATTITVLSTGAIGMDQAIALVIGQNIGTTATAALAAIGANVPTKRTALSHILFNLSTGLILWLIFPLAVSAVIGVSNLLGWDDPSSILALFHTMFSLFGILLFAPFIRQFVKAITWILPDKKSRITKHLDMSILSIPEVAVEAASQALKEASQLTLTVTLGKFHSYVPRGKNSAHVDKYNEELSIIHNELEELRGFFAAIRSNSPKVTLRYLGLLHALDHIQRLNHMARVSMEELPHIDNEHQPHAIIRQLMEHIDTSIKGLQYGELEQVVPQLSGFSQELAQFRRKQRADVFDVTAKGEVSVHEAFEFVQIILFVDGLAYHLWRMLHHLSDPQLQEEQPAADELNL
jgi:phosphate:Na+ symporter